MGGNARTLSSGDNLTVNEVDENGATLYTDDGSKFYIDFTDAPDPRVRGAIQYLHDTLEHGLEEDEPTSQDSREHWKTWCHKYLGDTPA